MDGEQPTLNSPGPPTCPNHVTPEVTRSRDARDIRSMALQLPVTALVRAAKCHRSLMIGGIAVLLLLTYIINPAVDVQYVPIPQKRDSYILPGRKLQEIIPHVSEDQSIHVQARFPFNYQLGGFLFKESGRTYSLDVEVTSSLIHSFSPYIEREAAKRFLDPPHDNIFLANSPAVLWFKNELVLVSRVWLDREKYEPRNDWPANHFADNWFYTQKFDKHMQPLSNGSIMGIPAPKQWWVGDGPIEPRLFKVQGHLLVSFNSAMAFGHDRFMDFTILWDMERNLPIIPKISGDTPMKNATEEGDMPRDKHWMALIQNDELYFVHNLDPLRVMKCSLTGFCDFIHSEKSRDGFIFSDHKSHLRGGTPFELYEWPYYISVAHSTMYKESNNHRYYTAHMVVLCVSPYRVVYVSNDLKIHPEIYRTAPMVRPRWIDDGFIFPVGIVLENKDWMTIGVHVNDFSSVLIRMSGMKQLMDSIIKLDQRQKAKRGPPVGYLQSHIHDAMENLTSVKFSER